MKFRLMIAILKVLSIEKCLVLSTGIMSAYNGYLLLVRLSKEIIITYLSQKISILIRTKKNEK